MINLRIRSGFSFRFAYGQPASVMDCIDTDVAVIADRFSTFGHIRWEALCKKAGKRPIYGVELPVASDQVKKKKPRITYVTFLARDNISSIYELFREASRHGHLSWKDVNDASGVEIILGDCPDFAGAQPSEHMHFMVHPGTPRAVVDQARAGGFNLVAGGDNRYPRYSDRGSYEVLLGRSASSQTYPLHIISEDEWLAVWGDETWAAAALVATRQIADRCTATLRKATLFKPDRPATLFDMCLEGATRKGVKLINADDDHVYGRRLSRELEIIAAKGFEDYFYILSDMMKEAHRTMFCGPARGSSAGSLVCYLLDITTVDPIKFDLVFERFIDINRSDLPDIDVDLSNQEPIFKYLSKKYGADKVARVGTAMLYKSASTIKEVAGALRISQYEVAKFKSLVDDREEGHPRVHECIKDALTFHEGEDLLRKYPEFEIATTIEGHPSHSSMHAAGVVITATPVTDYVSVNATNTSTQCEKRDAENIGLLKIDCLGLTQLSIFEHCLEMIGKSPDWIQNYPLDDQKAYDLFNSGNLTGIFQFNGPALAKMTNQITVQGFEDIVALTSLARPGPMNSGVADRWIERHNNLMFGMPNEYLHPSLEPILSNTLGCVIYQEQVMRICREIGGMDWPDVSAIRKAMGKSMGPEYMNKWGVKFIDGAVERGWKRELATDFWDQLCQNGSYMFNRSHAVAYSMISYWCAVLKHYHPAEFAAATMSTISDKDKIVTLLRDLEREGIKYKAVDIDKSTDRWTVIDGVLIGPLTGIKRIGPSKAIEILAWRERCRKNGPEDLPKSLEVLVKNATTDYDTLWPIRTKFPEAFDPAYFKNFPITEVSTLTENENRKDVLIVAELVKLNDRDKNDQYNLEKRFGKRHEGASKYMSLKVADDTGEIYVNVSPKRYPEFCKSFKEGGRPVYAFFGAIGPGYRMIHLDRVKHIGDLESEPF